MRTVEYIMAWQRDFFAAPSVWVVVNSDGFMSNIYDSKDAAMLEIRRYKNYRVREEHVHSMDLAQRRWLR